MALPIVWSNLETFHLIKELILFCTFQTLPIFNILVTFTVEFHIYTYLMHTEHSVTTPLKNVLMRISLHAIYTSTATHITSYNFTNFTWTTFGLPFQIFFRNLLLNIYFINRKICVCLRGWKFCTCCFSKFGF
jgi:hypothetical protein